MSATKVGRNIINISKLLFFKLYTLAHQTKYPYFSKLNFLSINII